MPEPDKLENYRRKRVGSVTTEPVGEVQLSPGGSLRQYCIQEHHAKRAGLHHDFRFEQEGVAVSLVFPKLFQFADGRARLAIRTEDHPVEYMSWEGVIESGYGEGEVKLVASGFLILLEFTDSSLRFRIDYGLLTGEYVGFCRERNQWLIRKR